MTPSGNKLEAPASMFRLLVECAALNNGKSTSYSDLQDLTTMLNSASKEEIDEKYFRKIISESEKLEDPDKTISKNSYRINALSRFAGYQSFHDFQKEANKIFRFLNQDVISEQSERSLQLLCSEKKFSQLKKKYDHLWTVSGIQLDHLIGDFQTAEGLNGGVILLFMDPSRTELIDQRLFSELLSSNQDRILPIWEDIQPAEIRIQYPEFDPELILKTSLNTSMVLQHAVNLLTQKRKGVKEKPDDKIQMEHHGSGHNIGKIEGTYISLKDQIFNNPK